jgi:hypothetical protein
VLKFRSDDFAKIVPIPSEEILGTFFTQSKDSFNKNSTLKDIKDRLHDACIKAESKRMGHAQIEKYVDE